MHDGSKFMRGSSTKHTKCRACYLSHDDIGYLVKRWDFQIGIGRLDSSLPNVERPHICSMYNNFNIL